MFDVGFSELLLLGLICLLVLGPERLPRVARTLGGISRKARSSWLNLRRSIEAEINAQELKQPLDQLRKDVRQAASELNAGAGPAARPPEPPQAPASHGDS